MKTGKYIDGAIIVFFLILSCSVVVKVSSQPTDSCTSNLDQLKNAQLLFDTSSLTCRPVWDSQSFILRYEQTTPSLWSFVLSAPNTNSYIGMGFSSDGMMVGSSAIVGWIGGDGTSTIKKYHLTGQKPSQVVVNEGNLQVLSNSSTIISLSSRIYMAFQLNTNLPEKRILYSVGPAGRLPLAPGYLLSEHINKVSTILNYASGESKTQSTSSSNLKRSHGILNMLGWGIIIPMGAMVARYLKAWDPIWFYSHTMLQSLGLIFGVAGIICGFVLDNRLSSNVHRHKGLGIFILSLGCLQVIAILGRPDKESKVRKLENKEK